MLIQKQIIEALQKARDIATNKCGQTVGSSDANKYLFKMIFIEKFLNDVEFLDSISENDNFYHRYGYMIIRNMLEQLIEFLYVLKNEQLIDEYLGLKINLEALNKQHTPVEGERFFGQGRYTKKRPTVNAMVNNIGDNVVKEGMLSLYNLYSILSEKCHNSYFDSWLKDINATYSDAQTVGLNEEQLTLLHTIILYVLEQYS